MIFPCTQSEPVTRAASRPCIGASAGMGWRLLAALGLVVVTACSGATSVDYTATHYLIDHLAAVEQVAPARHEPTAPQINLSGDTRSVVVQHAPAVYRFAEIPSGPGASLLVSPAMDPKSWDKPTNGAVFSVRCELATGEWSSLLTLEINPAENTSDRGWNDQELSLASCSVPRTRLEFETTCGTAGNCAADWTIWGNPRVAYEKSLVQPESQLAILISIDTLRADRLSVYGAARNTSPALEQLAADGIAFNTAIAPSPWTIPSHASLLTSTDPRRHGATAATKVAESLPTLASVLAGGGWDTAGFIDTPYLSRQFGFERGFNHYDDEPAPKGNFRRGAAVVRQRVQEYIGSRESEGPLFAFWHIMDVHGPFAARSPYSGSFRGTVGADEQQDPRLQEMEHLAYHDYLKLEQYRSLEDLVATYDEGIAQTDAEVGAFFDFLRQLGLYDDALIVVTSDHGESFLDHQVWVGHGLFLTDDELRVPLIVKLPQNRHAGTRVDNMVGLIDVAPTILDALGAKVPSSMEGLSIVSPSPGVPESLPRVRYAHSSNTGASALRTNDLKYISPIEMTPEFVLQTHLRQRSGSLSLNHLLQDRLFDLQMDPGERNSITTTFDSDRLENLRQALARQAAVSASEDASSEGPQLTPEAEAQLRALGYVN